MKEFKLSIFENLGPKQTLSRGSVPGLIQGNPPVPPEHALDLKRPVIESEVAREGNDNAERKDCRPFNSPKTSSNKGHPLLGKKSKDNRSQPPLIIGFIVNMYLDNFPCPFPSQ